MLFATAVWAALPGLEDSSQAAAVIIQFEAQATQDLVVGINTEPKVFIEIVML
jgi:hypothetical protein